MNNFWDTIDNNYFKEVENDEIFCKIKTIQTKKSNLAQVEFESCLPKLLIEKIERIFTKEKLSDFSTFQFCQTNYQNFLKHYVISLLSYSTILEFVKKKIAPCDSCLQKIYQLFSEKYNYSPDFSGEERHDLKILERESKALNSVISKRLPLFCNKCLSKIKHKRNRLKIQETNFLIESKNRVKSNSSRISNLIIALNKRITNENKLTSKISIVFELEVQKEYLFTSLIRIEQKLLAENIFRVTAVHKNQLAEIEFINYPSSYSVTLDELKFLNKLLSW